METKQPKRDMDSPWKEALECFFQPFMAFAFPKYHTDIDWSQDIVFLDKELHKLFPESQKGHRHVDKLAKVQLKSGRTEWVYIHIEVQANQDPVFNRRMFTYNYRLYDRFGEDVASFAVLCDTNATWRPNSYHYGWHDFEMGIKFPTFKLTDYADQAKRVTLESSNNPFALIALSQLVSNESHNDAQKRYRFKLNLFRLLLEKGFDAKIIVNLIKFLDWMMQLPDSLEEKLHKELHQAGGEVMTYVTSFERIAHKNGFEKGEARGFEKGQENGFEKGQELACRKLFEAGADIDFVTQVIGLSTERILEIKLGIAASQSNPK